MANKKRKRQIGRKLTDARDAAALEKGLRKIKGRIIRPAAGEGGMTVNIRPEEIETITAVFQPRSFFFGHTDLDPRHVGRLEHYIRTKGELDPPVVIKLRGKAVYVEGDAGDQWVCVDGHHRIAAYKAAGWDAPITCTWFGGTAEEAHFLSISENDKPKLASSSPDKFESAWKLTVLGLGGSKEELRKITGVSTSMIAKMRRVVRRYKEDPAFQAGLGRPLKTTPWGQAHAHYLGLTPQEKDAQREAGKLAAAMHQRLEDRLSRDYRQTAHALFIYDPELAEALIEHLSAILQDRRTAHIEKQE